MPGRKGATMKRLDTTHRLYAKEAADALAAELTEGDEDGWTYEAVHDPRGTGGSFIEIYDEAGDFVGRW